MSGIYVTNITLTRVPDSTSINDHNYEGREYPLVVIATDIPCTLQQKSYSNKPITGLPQDLSNDSIWNAYFKRKTAAKGFFKERDVLIDDLNRKFEVLAAYWNILGYKLVTKLLTT